MRNKVEPFYIEWTVDISPEKAMEILDKCVDNGAKPYCCIDDILTPHEYQYVVRRNEWYNYFGVDRYGETELLAQSKDFGEGAIELTIDQVDQHLGLKVEDTSKYHPHRDLMISYANDCTQTVEIHDGIDWVTLNDPCWQPQSKYRLVKKVTMSEIKAHFGENIKIIEE